MNEAAFLDAIVAEPDDDTHRLVFADWLDDHGDATWAAFIRAQVELATLDEADSRYPALLAQSRRCGMLTGPRQRPMMDHVPGGRAMFRRGLIAGVEVSPRAYLQGSGADWATVPCSQLRLLQEREAPEFEAAKLCQRSELSRVTTLCIAGYAGWRVADLEPLLTDCPSLATLRALRLGQGPTENEAIAHLIRNLACPSLDSLAVENRVDRERWRDCLPPAGPPLRRACFLGHEEDNGWNEETNESTWEWDQPDLDWLLASRHGPTLEVAILRLSVDHIDYGDYVAVAPPGAACARLATSQLRHLELEGWFVARLLAAKDWGLLQSLTLHGDLRDCVAAVLAAPQAAGLRSLVLDPLPNAMFRNLDPSDRLLIGHSLRHLALYCYDLSCLAGGTCPGLLRLAVGELATNTGLVESIATADLSELRWLHLRVLQGATELKALARSAHLPNLCTLLVTGTDAVTGWLDDLARARNLPHLSLVGVGRYQPTRWWVLGGGQALPVADEVIPLDEDWWDPLADWPR